MKSSMTMAAQHYLFSLLKVGLPITNTAEGRDTIDEEQRDDDGSALPVLSSESWFADQCFH